MGSLTTLPIQTILLSPVKTEKSFIFLLPKMFSKEPTFDPSDLLTCTFLASLYSPLGTNLASRSLFSLLLIKEF